MKKLIRNRVRHQTNKPHRTVETLEHRRVLAAIPFEANPVIDSGIGQSQMVEAAELTGDASIDTLALAGRQVVMFANTDGRGNFSEAIPVTEDLAGETRTIVVGDFDGDNDTDFIVGVRVFNATPALTLHTNDGQGNFTLVNEIALGTEAPFIDSLEAGDIDNDGDMDLVAVARGDLPNGVNPRILVFTANGDGSYLAPFDIINGLPNPRAIHLVDIDGDSDLDVVATTSDEDADDHRLVSLINTDGAGTFELSSESVTSPGAEPRFLSSGDFDGDGDFDLAVPHQADGILAIYENDGNGVLTQETIFNELRNIERTKVADLDSDGDDDILATLDTPGILLLFENIDGAFSDFSIVSDQVDSASGITVADFNSDGELDVAVSSQFSAQVHVLLNGGQNVGFIQTTLTDPNLINPNAAQTADIDGDGDLDVVSWSETDYELSWFENTDGAGTFGTQNMIADFAADPNTTIWWDVEVGDMDGDGDMDVVTTEPIFEQIVWYENTDGNGTFGNVNTFDEGQLGTLEIEIVDMDGDNDNDIMTAHIFADEIVWYENIDGLGTLQANTIASLAISRAETAVGDIDNDGDIDILVGDDAPTDPRSVVWYENIDGTFDEVQILKTDIFNIDDVKLADMDGDGDVDAFVAAWPDNMGNSRLEWFENTDGAGTFSETPNLIGIQLTAEELLIVDVDGDGDLDVAGISPYEGRIEWFENTDGKGTFEAEHTIDSNIADLGEHMGAGDINGDGRLDFVAAHGASNQIIWYDAQDDVDVNDDGATNLDDVHQVCSDIRNQTNNFDANGDGITDIDDMIILLNVGFGTVMGDSDLSGSFGTNDLVGVFGAGEYEDGIAGNSTWSTGDWNCDGDFGTSDLVLVFDLNTFDPEAVGALAPSFDDGEIGAAIPNDSPLVVDGPEQPLVQPVEEIMRERAELNQVRVDRVFADLADVLEMPENEHLAFVA